MFDVGFFELVLIAIIALLVIGPERLPHAARMTGAFIAKIRRTMVDLKAEVTKEVEYQEMQERIKQLSEETPLQKIHAEIKEPIDQLQTQLHSGESQTKASDNSGHASTATDRSQGSST